jgi:hypothetical protein
LPTAADVLTDFLRGSDKIDLSFMDANETTEAADRFSFVGGNAFSGAAGEVRYQAVSGGVHVFGDTDGDKLADFQIIVNGASAVDASDFFFG